MSSSTSPLEGSQAAALNYPSEVESKKTKGQKLAHAFHETIENTEGVCKVGKVAGAAISVGDQVLNQFELGCKPLTEVNAMILDFTSIIEGFSAIDRFKEWFVKDEDGKYFYQKDHWTKVVGRVFLTAVNVCQVVQLLDRVAVISIDKLGEKAEGSFLGKCVGKAPLGIIRDVLYLAFSVFDLADQSIKVHNARHKLNDHSLDLEKWKQHLSRAENGEEAEVQNELVDFYRGIPKDGVKATKLHRADVEKVKYQQFLAKDLIKFTDAIRYRTLSFEIASMKAKERGNIADCLSAMKKSIKWRNRWTKITDKKTPEAQQKVVDDMKKNIFEVKLSQCDKKINRYNAYIEDIQKSGGVQNLAQYKINKKETQLTIEKRKHDKAWVSIAATLSKVALITFGFIVLGLGLTGFAITLSISLACLVVGTINLAKFIFEKYGEAEKIEPNPYRRYFQLAA